MPKLINLLAALLLAIREVRLHPAPSLVWRVQHASYSQGRDHALRHIAKSYLGVFEIFEDDGNFLLFFPRELGLPADLFRDIDKAKQSAQLALVTPPKDGVRK